MVVLKFWKTMIQHPANAGAIGQRTTGQFAHAQGSLGCAWQGAIHPTQHQHTNRGKDLCGSSLLAWAESFTLCIPFMFPCGCLVAA